MINTSLPIFSRVSAQAAGFGFSPALPLGLALMMLAFTAGTAHAATDIADVPLETSSSVGVKPNIMFILDDSGSMNYLDMPDISDDKDAGYRSYLCNKIYFNPNKTYLPPLKYDGTSYPNSNFTGAWRNGFKTSDGTRNLSTQFHATDPNGTNEGVAYYYAWGSGTAPTTTNCEQNAVNGSGNLVASIGSWTKTNISGAVQQQNFANWYSYYRSRLLMMKTATGKAFQEITAANRVGFITINPGSPVTASKYLAIADFTQGAGGQKDLWYTKLYGQVASPSTPLREALARVGRHYAGKTSGLNSGMPEDPVQYSCQRNYAILTTDGYWNSNAGQNVNGSAVGNQDAGSAGNNACPICEGNTASNTLADVAQYYYVTDLRPTGSVNSGGIDVSANNVLVSGSGVEEDSNTAQHMTTFTFGLGVNGNLTYRKDYKTAGTGDYYDIKNQLNGKKWPVPVADAATAVDDLWHAAVNGRGLYLSADDPDTAASALGDVINTILGQGGTGAGSAASNLKPTIGDNLFFTPSYKPGQWSGEIEARAIDLVTGLPDTVSWKASTKVDASVGAACDNRVIYLFNTAAANNLERFALNSDGCNAAMAPKNTPVTALTATEQTAFNVVNAVSKFSHYPLMTDGTSGTVNQRTTAAGSLLVNYVRGQKGREDFTPNDLNRLYRKRSNVLGDFVHSQPVHIGPPVFLYDDATNPGYSTFKTNNVAREKMIFAASNDGMLHAFKQSDGSEAWNFMPSMVLTKLYQRADKNLSNLHKYLLDGSPVVGDVYNGVSWSSILVGGMGRGDKGYYALDVTSPLSPKALWEFKPGACYVSGTVEYTDCDMGYSIGLPVIAKLPSGQWVVFVTAGLNNVNTQANDGKGILYVLEARTGRILQKLVTSVGSAGNPSGLSEMGIYATSLPFDHTVSRIYAGDLLGNLWRFDLSGTTGLGPISLMASVNQPITAAPAVSQIGLPSKALVAVVTGRYLGIADVADTQTQTIYAFTDNLDGTVSDPRNSAVMAERTLNNVGNTRTVTCAAPGCTVDREGWYADLPDSGERGTITPVLFGGILVIPTNVPSSAACTSGGSSWLNVLDAETGGPVNGTTVGETVTDTLISGVTFITLPSGQNKVIVTLSGPTGDTTGAGGNPNLNKKCKGQLCVFDPPQEIAAPEGEAVSWHELIKQ